MGSHFLLQGIFPTQGSNPGLPHCRRILYNKTELGKLPPLSVPEFPQLWNGDNDKTSLMALLWLNKSVRKALHERIPNVSQCWYYYFYSHPKRGYINARAPLLRVKEPLWHQIWIVTELNIHKIFLKFFILASLGLHCCLQAFSSCSGQGLPWAAVPEGFSWCPGSGLQ